MTLQDMPGPMTRTVSDAAIALELLVDKTQSGKGSQDYTKVLKTDGLRALHIGWDPLVLQEVAALGWQPSKDVVALFNSAVSQLTLAGVNTKQVSAVMPLLPALQDLSNASFACMPVDFKEGINAYLQARGRARPPSRWPMFSPEVASGFGAIVPRVRPEPERYHRGQRRLPELPDEEGQHRGGHHRAHGSRRAGSFGLSRGQSARPDGGSKPPRDGLASRSCRRPPACLRCR